MKTKLGSGGRHGSIKAKEGSKRMKKVPSSMVLKMAARGKKK